MMNKTILHIETATHICSVCISRGEEILAIRETDEPNSHSRILTVYIEEILKETGKNLDDMDALALSLGPGSYTGLRIGASVIKGLAYGSGLPVIGLDTLQIMARGVMDEHLIPSDQPDESLLLRPMIDARRMEAYTAPYSANCEQKGAVRALILEPETFMTELETHRVFFFGNGSDKARELISHPQAVFLPDRHPSSRFMPGLALKKLEQKTFLNTAYFEPFYLKDFIATIPKKK